MTLDMQSGPQRVTLEAGEAFARAAADSTPSATDATTTRARCLACARPITAAESIRLGFGPVCWTRITTAQRHERAEALHGRLRALLRRLPTLDVRSLALVSAALDDLDGLGVTA